VAGRVTVHFQFTQGAKGSATWSDSFRVIRAPDEFSGYSIERIPVLHATELIVQIWPKSVSEFLTKKFKLTISLTASGGVDTNPVLPTVALGFQQELYTEIIPTRQSRATLHHGGRSGTFDIQNVIAAGGPTKQNLRITGSWSCSGMMHFTSKV
jgi:hypothetical protein